ncbi:ataxin-7-like protein 2b isoform X1 [Osmerus eperlanus]|uniref:ataxin-7-like protein 2b isoform X1 n=1 Tax=Osmerus eperlanus TaxID=29151 RepID=UPI002E108C37
MSINSPIPKCRLIRGSNKCRRVAAASKQSVLHKHGPIPEECNKYEKKRAETMTLMKEDMSIYGHCPERDDFYLVVCSHCGQVIKPQAFEKHCERRHGSMSKLCSPPFPSAHQQRPRPGRPPSLAPPPRERLASRHQGAEPPSTPSVTQHRPVRSQKEEVSLPPVEELSQDSPPLPSDSPSPRPRASPLESGPQTPDKTPYSTPQKLPLQRAVAGQLEDTHLTLGGRRTDSRTFKKVYKKECDLDKHCGVLDPERKKLCTRQLMCNIHSIHQRRKVLGRSKTFDQLVAEQRTGSKGRDLEQTVACRDSPKEPLPHTEDPVGPQHSRRVLSNCTILRSRDPSESGEEDEENGVGVEVQPPYPFNQSLPSSEGSDSEDQEDAGEDLPATPWHPRPMGLCTFGSHTMGCSVFTFDRRLHHLRFALSAMMEHHLSAHLWKKIPQMTGLRSHQASITPPISTGLSVRAGSRAAPLSRPSLRSPPTSHPHRASGRENCSSSPGSTSPGQSQTKSGQHNPSSSTPRHAPGPGRPRNPVGRPSKARLRERELMRAANAEKTKPPCDEDQTPKHIREHPLQERGRQPDPARLYPSPSFQGPVNGALTVGKKPCTSPQPSEWYSPSPGSGKRPPPPPLRPPLPSPRGRGRPPGLHRRVGGYDHKGLAKKRKSSSSGGGGGSPSLSTPSSLAPKSLCLTPHSQPSMLSWRGESMGGVLARGMEKRIDPQRPKGTLPTLRNTAL